MPLPHGASMGDKYGPILVARRPISAAENAGALRGLTIGIPGTLTSAYLTLQMFDPDFTPQVMPFDEILEAVRKSRIAMLEKVEKTRQTGVAPVAPDMDDPGLPQSVP